MEIDNNVLEKIRKLFQITTDNGATESEMENALKLAQRLMMRYNIDNSHILISSSDIETTRVEYKNKSHEAKFWIWDLLDVVAECYSCKTIRVKRKGVHYYEIIGTNDDRLVVKNTVESMLPLIRTINELRYKEYIERIRKERNLLNLTIKNLVSIGAYSKRVYSNSYIQGFLIGLGVKLQKDRNDFLNSEKDKHKYSIILVKKTDLIEEYIQEKLKPKMAKTRTSKEFCTSAYNTGIADGSEKNANKQLH